MITYHEVLRRPIITEKSNYQVGTLNQYVFEVALGATKNTIKDAVETLFDVNVVNVNIVNGHDNKRSLCEVAPKPRGGHVHERITA